MGRSSLNWPRLKQTCVCAHRSKWFAKVIECSKPSIDFFVVLFCCTQVCVLTAAIGRPALGQGQKPLSLAEEFKGSTHMCVLTAAIGQPTHGPLVQPLIALFCYTHVCADSSNWSANPELISSATHTCVCAHGSNWSAKVLRMYETFS